MLNLVLSILTKSIFSRILGSKVGVQVVYSCGLYTAVYGIGASKLK